MKIVGPPSSPISEKNILKIWKFQSSPLKLVLDGTLSSAQTPLPVYKFYIFAKKIMLDILLRFLEMFF